MVSFGFAALGPKGYGIAIRTVHSALEKATVKSSALLSRALRRIKIWILQHTIACVPVTPKLINYIALT